MSHQRQPCVITAANSSRQWRDQQRTGHSACHRTNAHFQQTDDVAERSLYQTPQKHQAHDEIRYDETSKRESQVFVWRPSINGKATQDQGAEKRTNLQHVSASSFNSNVILLIHFVNTFNVGFYISAYVCDLVEYQKRQTDSDIAHVNNKLIDSAAKAEIILHSST
jgi:hypothetical protein